MDITVVLSTAVNEKLATASARNQSASVRFKGRKSGNAAIAIPSEIAPIASPRRAPRLICRECAAAFSRNPGAANTGLSNTKFETGANTS